MLPFSTTSRIRWRRWAFGIAGSVVAVAVVAPPFGLRRDRNTYQCQTCFSKRHELQWKVGNWTSPSLPVSPKHIVLEESRTFQCFVPPNHEHRWVFSQGSPYYWFGTSWGGCALGSGRHRNDLVDVLESPFGDSVEFLAEKLRTGKLTTNELLAALAAPRHSPKQTNRLTDSQQLAARLTDEFFDRRPIVEH